jgi:hypothetical protein
MKMAKKLKVATGPNSKETKKDVKGGKGAAPKAMAKAERSTAPNGKKKPAEEEVAQQAAPEGVDPDELEEQEEAAAARSGGNGNAAALAAATGTGEMSASFKNFRHHPDMENFYRFIYENDLRHEALAIIDQIMIDKQTRKVTKSGKSAH